MERSETPDRYRWDLTPLYPAEAAWSEAKEAVAGRIPTIERYRGHLGDSPTALYEALAALMDLDRDLTRLNVYASMRSDEDVRVAKNLEMKSSAEQLAVTYHAAVAFVRPELLALGAEKITDFIAAERLVPFKPYLDDILRRAPHTLTASEEKIAAQAGLFAHSGENIRSVFTNAELPYPEVTLASGETVRLDASGYTRYRASAHPADREAVFRTFWGKHSEYQGTLGAALNAQVRAHVFNRDVHKYSSCLEAALFRDNVPTSVYTQLIAGVRANLPTLHRYLKLRQRIMGLPKLGYQDLYAPIVPEVDLHFTPEQAMEMTLAAVRPLGMAYVDTLAFGFAHHWVDWMPNTGKASGAYSTGAYGVHPFQLQNFTGLYEEVSTLAHESGHSMHTYLADQHQPYVTRDYATFVAEVASTLNENLLFHHMLGTTQDRNTKLFLLGSYLDVLRTTLFRQTLFAEFELAIHEMVERGETLSGENLSARYLALVRTYYGHDQGVCTVDSLYAPEWSYVDHFFYDFYMFQYATSIVASTAIANGIREEAAPPHSKDKAALATPKTARRDAYLAMLSSGSSQYPIDLLKGAGVDMTTSAPFQAAMREMNAVMDEIEKLIAKK